MKLKVKIAEKKQKDIPITTEFIRLDSAMKLADIAGTGGIAKMMIQDGEVKVNGEVCLSRGKKLRPGDSFEFERVIYNIR
ncbi:MAG: RNA-binding S4 domain-containing protein [Ruminococcaceae bacterium]|nr:RNA-binding S4 domain-containing protein [Oscillospiraceae bacterium]MBQ6874441.1 RNA-binding S4 domain-containing protein [Clostridia bacterium]